MTEALLTKPKVAKKNIAAPKSLTAPFLEGLQEYTGTWDTPQVVHLLKRMLFGAKDVDLSREPCRNLWMNCYSQQPHRQLIP